MRIKTIASPRYLLRCMRKGYVTELCKSTKEWSRFLQARSKAQSEWQMTALTFLITSWTLRFNCGDLFS